MDLYFTYKNKKLGKKFLLYKNFRILLKILDQIPIIIPTYLDLLSGINAFYDIPFNEKKIEKLLRKFIPWRKGPFSLYNIFIDAEWRSDWKWERIIPHITPLNGRLVLDIGCGNGYYLWRMVGYGAKLAIGVDPIPLFYFQFEAIKKLLGRDLRVHLLPIGIEDLATISVFDSVFSMGVLYHRRSPIDHLIQIKNFLVSGVELILETLVVNGNDSKVLVPYPKYANMHNVYFIPSPSALMLWLKKCGFVDIRQVNQSITTIEEQRSTSWMTGKSLSNFLYPNNYNITIEGYPAPKRAIFIAKKP